ncbi:MAG: BrnT family toxin [Cyclobacteriaceae bacterium]|nr:BrnT family toxin [Cyclobacteriaceae bacterium]
MALVFEWDSVKAQRNLTKHKVSFEEAATILADENSLTIEDVKHSMVEKRKITLGQSFSGRILVVVHTERVEKLRIISARMASQKEKKQYGV